MSTVTIAVDPTDPDWFLRPDIDEVFATLRTEDPLCEYAPGHRVVTRYADIRAMSADPERFCSSRGAVVNDPVHRGHAPLTASPAITHIDPPEHVRYRRLVSRSFTPRAIRALEPRIRAMTRDLLDAVPVGDEIDVVEHLAVPLPIAVIAELLGVPAGQRDDFRRWSDATIEAGDYPSREVFAVIGEFFAFLGEHVAAKRSAPGDDLVSTLVQAEVDGHRLTDDELLVFCMTLLIAGNETTRHLISGGLLALAQHPGQRAVLAARPEGVARAVEEMLRWVTPVRTFCRTATRDAVLGGVPIAEGDYLVMLYASANRDESVFGPTASRFDITRVPEPAHLSFGFGEHLCLGASLARLEARVLFEEVLARWPGYEVTGEPVRTRSTIMHGLVSLPARLRS